MDGKPGANVVAPRLTELIRVEGKIDYDGPSDTPVRGVVFRGLTFTQADRWPWEAGKTGWGLQHDWEMFDRPTAMLRFRGAESCRVEDCRFVNSGSAGVRLDLHCQKISVTRCELAHLGGAGVLLAGYGMGTKDVNRDNAVTDCHVHHVGRLLWHSAGIWAWQSGHNRIEHNHVHHTPYTGILATGRTTWTAKATANAAAPCAGAKLTRCWARNTPTGDGASRSCTLARISSRITTCITAWKSWATATPSTSPGRARTTVSGTTSSTTSRRRTSTPASAATTTSMRRPSRTTSSRAFVAKASSGKARIRSATTSSTTSATRHPTASPASTSAATS